MTKQTRRNLLGFGMKSVGLAALTGIGRLSGQTGAPSNRVLIVIDLLGGEDSNNLLVPFDVRRYGEYARGRGELALAQSALLPVEGAGGRALYAVPVEMPEVADLFASKTLAFVANVGDLPSSMTKAQYLANPGAVDQSIFSHSGNSKRTYLPDAALSPAWSGAAVQQSPDEFSQRIFSFSSGVTSAAVSGSWFTGARRDDPTLLNVMNSIDVRTTFPNNGIGRMMKQAVRLAAAGPMLGLGAQIITIPSGGWDTHRDGLSQLKSLQTQLSQALGAFYQAARELIVWENVTVFTSTEFNRQLAPNQLHGSEHGWGGHRIVMGGGVNGGEVYGAFPSLELGGPDDVSGRGTLLPTTSTQQFSATLATWWGMSPAARSTTFPDAGADLGIFSRAAAASIRR